MDIDARLEELQAQLKTVGERMADKAGIPADEYTYLKAEVTRLSEAYEEGEAKRRMDDLSSDVEQLKARVAGASAAKANAILAGTSIDRPSNDVTLGSFIKAVHGARFGDPHAYAALEAMKATVGDSDANGGYAIPNNLVASIIEVATQENVWRGLLNVVNGVRGAGIDIPYEDNDSSIQKAILQGSFGSNKDNRNFTLSSATATLYTVAAIFDVGNQLLRQSEGAIESLVRSKLGRRFALAEADFIVNGTGSSQPKGLLNATGISSTTLSSEPRASAIGRAIGAVDARFYRVDAIVMNPTDYWETVTEGLDSYTGGWAMNPAAGAATLSAQGGLTLWGVPVYRDTTLTAGTALVGAFREIDVFFGSTYNVRVSDEAGSRFDQNLTGFRAEEEIAFQADPYVRKFQKVTGL
jgi:HK97 family phage major capsid protein